MRRPRILVVAPLAPYPLDSGTKIRVNNLARGLSDVGDVDLITYGSQRDFDKFPECITDGPAWWPALGSVRVVPSVPWPEIDPPTFRTLIRRRIFARTGLLHGSFPMAPLRVGPLAAAADLVWATHLYTGIGLYEHASKTVVDFNDLESAKTGKQASVESSPYMRWAFRREAARLARDEHDAVRQFARVAVCSSVDATLLGDAEPERIWVLPNGVDDALFDVPAVVRDARRLVFVGTMSYEPNREAVHFFHREILPRVRARLPEVTLDIVGNTPPPSVTALHDGSTVFVHPDVPSVAPFVQRAAVSIVPLRVGGGTRLKILESLALGTPVVSTTVGAEGLDLASGEHLVLADTAEAFADAVIRSLCERDHSEQLALAGRRRASDLYRWSKIRERVATLSEKWLAVRSTRAA